MANVNRFLQTTICLAVSLFYSFAAVAGPYDPPPTYYSGATGTGATLKQELHDIMTSGHSLKTYGEARYILDDTDEDPNNSNNVLLTYNRISVSGTWMGGVGGTVFSSREHVWPTSFRPDSGPCCNNSYKGIGSDLQLLKPLDAPTNSSRGNKPFGLADTTGSNGAVAPIYYFPGDADKGDSARIMFYGATRWKDEGMDLVNGAGNSATYDMGDLASLIAWHFLDPPDDFELRRNHLIDGEQSNRNAFIDRPEFAWSVYMDQNNDSQLSVGGAPGGDGSSSTDVALGPVIVGAAVPADQSVTLDKIGFDGTYYEVSTSGDATSSVTGRYNAFAIDATGSDSSSLSVGLATSTATAGQQTGTVTIDNLDVTTSGGAGVGDNDGDDLINVTLDVLDHANASFSNLSDLNTLDHDFGTVSQGSSPADFEFDITNLIATLGFTADLELDLIIESGDSTVLLTDLDPFTGVSSLEAGSSNAYNASFDTSTLGSFAATYTLNFSDEDLPGATALADLTLNLMGTVEALLAGDADFNEDGIVDGVDYLALQSGLGITSGATLAQGDANGDGAVDDLDLTVWEQQFGITSLQSIAGSTASVPEPSAFALTGLATCLLCLLPSRKN